MSPDMWDDLLPWAVVLLGSAGVGGIVGAVLAYRRGTRADLMAALSARLSEVEHELSEHRAWRSAQETRYSSLWAYCRQLIDYAYRHKRDDAPPIPDMPAELG